MIRLHTRKAILFGGLLLGAGILTGCGPKVAKLPAGTITRVEAAASKAEAAAKRAEQAAQRANSAADRAEAIADKAAASFRDRLRK